MLKSIFISFHCDKESIQYVTALKLFIKRGDNKNFKICSIGNTINSSNKSYIKRIITSRIDACNEFTCLISKNTQYSNWVNWEVNTAYNLNKPIFIIKLHNNYIIPKSFFGKDFNIITSVKDLIL